MERMGAKVVHLEDHISLRLHDRPCLDTSIKIMFISIDVEQPANYWTEL